MLDAPAEPSRTAPAPAVRRRRSLRRLRGLGPAYYQVAVRWGGWALALIITLVGAAPATNLAAAGLFLALTFVQTALFTVYYPVLHQRLRPYLPRLGRQAIHSGAVWAAVDLLLSVAAVAGTGGFRSPFFQYAMTAVMFPALIFRWRGAIISASVFVVLYSLAVVFAGDGWDGVVRSGQFDSLVAALADGFLVALFAAYLADILRRLEVERRRTALAWRETGALYAVAESVLESPPEIEALYERVVTATRRYLRLPGFGVYTVEGDRLKLVAGYRMPPSLDAPAPAQSLGAGAGRPERTSHLDGEDADACDATDSLELGSAADSRAQWSADAPTYARAPLIVDGREVGWLVALPRGVARAQVDVVLQALAGQVALGLRNAELAREKAELAAAAERARLAREIHDGVAQSLYMLTLNIEACADLAANQGTGNGRQGAEVVAAPAAPRTDGVATPRSAPALAQRLEQLLGLARQALWEVRHYIFDLKPMLGGDAPLAEMLRNPLREFESIAGLPVELHSSGVERRLEPRARAAVYRVLQEALANTFKHARASRVDVALRWEAAALTLEVRDDGRGFDPPTVARGHGLDNLQQRAAEVGGTAGVESAPGGGTRVWLRVPYADGGGDR